MMAPKKTQIALNVEQFIHNVEERPAIWNRNFHCNKAFLEQMWDELSAEHKLPKAVLKAKWKGLRDNFRVEYKRIPRTDSGQLMIEPALFDSKWIHYYALLFLIDHMRHRAPKNEKDQAYMLTQQSQDTVEKTIVEPDLTNGLISRLQDSDEEFDEIDADEFDIDDDKEETTNTIMVNTIDDLPTTPTTSRPSAAVEGFSPATSTAAALMVLQNNTKTPPAAHAQSRLNRSAHLFIKCEEVANTILKDVNFLGTPPHAHSASQTSTNADIEAAAEDLSATTSIAFLNRIAQKLRNQTPTNDNNIQQEQQQQQQQQSVMRNSTSGSTSTESVDILRNRRTLMDPFNIPTVRTHVPQDDDYHYLLSLHPYMHQLKGPQKLRTRTKIQKLIFKELFFNNGSGDASN